MLKSKQTAGHNHPVVKRLLQYRNVTKATDKKRTKLSELVSDSGSADSGSEDSDETYEDLTGKAGKNKPFEKGDQYETTDERAALEYCQMMKAGRPGEDTLDEEFEQELRRIWALQPIRRKSCAIQG
ncbi:hypothetical protein DPMN_081498 [Dreissena polymorpha]|uniref:Uncharacterized protein n=1 Tax=Dreissena polymorpha TaxID=45954 RepID=A0A9D4BGK2_DREPO|nr:hypothetical protein DPMN_081498 [Dreissena polymorpha]